MRNALSRLLAFGLILCVTLVGGCKSVGDAIKSGVKPTARITAVKFQELSLTKVDLVFDVEVTNPYGVSLPLLDLSYSIGSSGQKVLAGGVKPSTALPANGSTVIQVPTSISFVSLMSIVKTIRPGQVVPYRADFTVGVDAPVIGAVSIPLTHEGEIPVPAIPDVSLISLQIDSLNFDKVETTLKLRVRNTNQFDLDLARLGLNLALGGQQVASTSVDSPTKLPPGQTATVAIPASFSPRAFGIGVFNLLRGTETGYGMTGSLEVGTRFGPVTMPFDHQGNASISR